MTLKPVTMRSIAKPSAAHTPKQSPFFIADALTASQTGGGAV